MAKGGAKPAGATASKAGFRSPVGCTGGTLGEAEFVAWCQEEKVRFPSSRLAVLPATGRALVASRNIKMGKRRAGHCGAAWRCGACAWDFGCACTCACACAELWQRQGVREQLADMTCVCVRTCSSVKSIVLKSIVYLSFFLASLPASRIASALATPPPPVVRVLFVVSLLVSGMNYPRPPALPRRGGGGGAGRRRAHG
jgi:hypothetical protein